MVILLAWLVPIGVLVLIAAINWNRDVPSLPPPPPEARWAPDPTRRHQLRLWDGQRWTANVSNDGRSGWDPLPE